MEYNTHLSPKINITFYYHIYDITCFLYFTSYWYNIQECVYYFYFVKSKCGLCYTWLSKSYSLSLAHKIPSFLGRPCTISRKWIIIGPVIKIRSALSHSCFPKLPCEGSHRTSVGPWGTWRILRGYLSPLQLKSSNPSPPAAFFLFVWDTEMSMRFLVFAMHS